MIRRTALALAGLLVFAGGLFAHNIIIEHHEIPLEIDTYGRFKQNTGPFMWAQFDSMRTHWDLTGYPGGYFARIGLRDYDEGRPPAPESMEVDFPDPEVCEMDTLGSASEQWVYLYKDEFALWLDGIDFSQATYRFIGNYVLDLRIYATPMYDGSGWITATSWAYEIIPGIPYQASEQHTKRIVAKGKVKVPLSGDYYWPCLVIRDRMIFTDNFGTEDRRWIYEWVVPGHFLGGNGVAAAMSQNGASEDFIVAEQLFQMERCDIPGWDGIPPTFANATVVGDTDDTGPYVVSVEIEDDEEDIGADSLFYRVDGGAWTAVESDSDDLGTCWYTIPSVTAPATVDYYFWAMDDFCETEEIEFWSTWPVCSPESTMITFHVTGVGVEEPGAPGAGGAVTVSPNPFTRSARFTVSLAGTATAEVRLYDLSGQLVRSLSLYADGKGPREATWDGTDFRGRRLAAGTYIWRVTGAGCKEAGKLVLDR